MFAAIAILAVVAGGHAVSMPPPQAPMHSASRIETARPAPAPVRVSQAAATPEFRKRFLATARWNQLMMMNPCSYRNAQVVVLDDQFVTPLTPPQSCTYRYRLDQNFNRSPFDPDASLF